MNMTRLIKVLPMLVTVAALAYAAYSIQPVVPILTPAAGAAKAGKQAPVEGAGQAVTKAGSRRHRRRCGLLAGTPLRLRRNPTAARNDKNSTPELEKDDPSLVALEGLTLDATFLQGRTQMAIIDGRIYEPGQNLVGANDEPSPLIVTQVFMNKVIFQAEGKRYFLAYPDQLGPPTASAEEEPAAPGQGELPPGLGSQDLGSQLAMIRALLSSPNGGAGHWPDRCGGRRKSSGRQCSSDEASRCQGGAPARRSRVPGRARR